MAYLIDTHIALWALGNPDRLPRRLAQAMSVRNVDWYVSYVSAWEVELKHFKRPDIMHYSGEVFAQGCIEANFKLADLKLEHITSQGQIACLQAHSDPFDRALVAQAIYEGMEFVTCDKKLLELNEKSIVDGQSDFGFI